MHGIRTRTSKRGRPFWDWPTVLCLGSTCIIWLHFPLDHRCWGRSYTPPLFCFDGIYIYIHIYTHMYIYIYSPKVSPVWCFFLIHPPLSDSICTTSEDQRKYVHWRTYHVCFALYWDDDVQCLYSMPSTSSKFIMEHHETNVHGHMCWKSSNSPPVVIDLGVEFSSYSVRVCWKKKNGPRKSSGLFIFPIFPMKRLQHQRQSCTNTPNLISIF